MVRYRRQAVIDWLIEQETNWTKNFTVSARGWGYILENHRVIDKGDLDAAEDLINKLRKNGTLPLDICAEDVRCQDEGKQRIDGSIEDELGAWERGLRQAPSIYTPTGFWDDQDVYIELGSRRSTSKTCSPRFAVNFTCSGRTSAAGPTSGRAPIS
jgi:hypothetical protein